MGQGNYIIVIDDHRYWINIVFLIIGRRSWYDLKVRLRPVSYRTEIEGWINKSQTWHLMNDWTKPLLKRKKLLNLTNDDVS